MFLKVFNGETSCAVPVRTSGDQLYRLKKFTLRLFNASDIKQPNVEVRILASVECNQIKI